MNMKTVKAVAASAIVAASAAVSPQTAVADGLLAVDGAKPCLSLPTTWLGATSVMGDGVTFDTKLARFQNALSVSFWIKNPTARSENGGIKYGYVVGNGAYSGKRGFAVGYQEETVNGKLIRGFNLQVKDNTAGSADPSTMFSQCVVSCDDIQDGEWHHIAIVYDAANRRIVGYYDGEAQVGDRTTWPVPATTDSLINNLSIGRNAENNGWAFGGELAELSLWNCALSDEQVRSILAAPIDSPQSRAGLLAYWKFDEGEGSSAADATGLGNTGTVKTAAGAACTTYWGNDFDGYNAVKAQVTGYFGPEDGESHACACRVTQPADGYMVKWAWNDDLESFTHDAAETFAATGVYTNRCRVTCEGYKSYTGEATVAVRPTYYVATNGSDSATGKVDSPLLTITEAVERLGAAGGCAFLKDGTYMLEKKFDTYPCTETVDYTCGWCVQVRAPIEIIGLSHNPKRVILDAQNAQCALMVMNHPNASIRYLTLQNACAVEEGEAGTYGGGNLRIDAGTVSDCIFRNGKAKGLGGNLWVSASAERVSRCVFYGGSGISISTQGSSVFAIGDTDKGVYPIVDNCFIYGAGIGGASSWINKSAVTARGGARFVNCTISGSVINGVAAYLYDTDSRFVNCAIYDNAGNDVNSGAGFVSCAAAAAISKGKNCRVVTEPMFRNAAAGNYKLRQGSPLIGAGDFAAYRESAVSETDVIGKRRFWNNAISIGCYEYVQRGFMIDLR